MNIKEWIVENKQPIREWIEAIVVAFILAMVIRAFVIQAFKIPTGSMRLTLIERDHILVNKLRYGPLVPFTKYRLPGFRSPQRGDIIVFKSPVEPKKDFIKRLIGQGGELVEIKNGDVYINDQLVEDPIIKNNYYYNRGNFGVIGKKVKVPQGHYFVLGDNSKNSHDGRYWGFVPEEAIIGKAEIIYWPLTRIRIIN